MNPIDLESLSQVSLYGTGASSCGYCSSSSKSSRVSYGIDSQYITPTDYQALIDRGWRRSGTYIYLPDNKLSCCPNWTIRVRAPDFKPTRHHRKVKNKFEHFIKSGANANDSSPAELSPRTPDQGELAFTEMQAYLRCAVDEVLHSIGEDSPPPYTIKPGKAGLVCNVALVLVNRYQKQQQNAANPGVLANKISGHLQKFRLRDGEQLITVSNDSNGFLHFLSDSLKRMKMPSIKKGKKPSQPSKLPGTSGVNFSAQLVASKFSKEAFDVYRLYQVAVHKDAIDRLTEHQYRNFLCDSPIVSQQSADPSVTYGSFHVEYRFDEKLIGVSVVDILPKCVSSVYFFYDPDYAFLSLGIWSALYEISLIPNSELLPDLSYYYLGYYVHNCPKMRYKKQFSPAELLCSEKLSWHPLEKCIAALDDCKYVEFSTISEATCPPDPAPESGDSVDGVPFLFGGQGFGFRDLKPVARGRLMGIVQEYYDKLGPTLATRRFVVTNIFMTVQ